ncbi:MAG: hypothetical protein ACLFQ8_00020 [Candidatus Aenigmatarchaeota archaeon]
MKKIALLMLFASTLAISGCVSTSKLSFSEVGLLGLGEPEYILREEISVNVNPSPSTVRPGRRMEAFFDVANTGNTTLENVSLESVDSCVFSEGKLDEIPANNIESGEKRTVNWNFSAPNDINMGRTCDMRYRVSYDSMARAVFNVRALSEDEYILREKAGDLDKLSDVRYEKTKTPVEIMANVSEEQPMMAGDDFLVHFHLENKGDGFVRGRAIDEGDIIMSYPQDILSLESCQGRSSTKNGNKIYFHETDIRDGGTAKTSCKFSLEDSIDTSVTGTFHIDVGYTYVKDGSYTVSLEP